MLWTNCTVPATRSSPQIFSAGIIPYRWSEAAGLEVLLVRQHNGKSARVCLAPKRLRTRILHWLFRHHRRYRAARKDVIRTASLRPSCPLVHCARSLRPFPLLHLTVLRLFRANSTLPFRWSYPKGRLKDGESIKDAARREFVEETQVPLDCVDINNVQHKHQYSLSHGRVRGVAGKLVHRHDAASGFNRQLSPSCLYYWRRTVELLLVSSFV